MISANRRRYTAIVRLAGIVAALILFGPTLLSSNTTTAISNHYAVAQKTNSSNNVAAPINTSDDNNNKSATTRTTSFPNYNIERHSMFRMQPPLPPPFAVSNVTGSIPLFSIISKSITSNMNTSLTNATIAAEKSTGNNSHAILARLGFENGFLVYTIWAVNPDMKVHKVTIDAGNGKILSNRQISALERRQLEMDIMIGTPPLPLPPRGMFMMEPPLIPPPLPPIGNPPG
jgi:hypothetical protein